MLPTGWDRIRSLQQLHEIAREPVGIAAWNSRVTDLDFWIQRGYKVGRFARWRSENVGRFCVEQLRSFRMADRFPASGDHIAMRS